LPCYPALANKTPFYFASSSTAAATTASGYFVPGFTNYKASIIPLPLTSPTTADFFWIFLNYFKK